LIKAATAAAVSTSIASRALADDLELKMSGYPHEHIRALVSGDVQIDGATVSYSPGKIGDINSHVFSGPRELAFTEIGLSPYLIALNDGFDAYSLIPVFPFRIFRHRSIFVHDDSGIEHPSQLKGKRVGTAGYSSTSLTWIRGIMQDEYGLAPEDVEWVVSAEDSSTAVAGGISAQESMFPDGLTHSVGPAGKDESELLVDGDVDALYHAAEPRAFVEGHPRIRRLFRDSDQVERDYYTKTGIYPIMHGVCIRNDLVEEHPWLPKAVFDAYSASKAATYVDMKERWFLRTIPWFAGSVEQTTELMGDNFYPYGLDPNRKALDALLRYMYEQRLMSRRLQVDELFRPFARDLVES
jgi:4,5-dihydroxyphthalate decarboxylase